MICFDIARIIALEALILLALCVFTIDVFATDITPIDGSGVGRRLDDDGRRRYGFALVR